MAIETVTVSRNDGVSELLPDVALAPGGKLVCIYRESDTDFVRNYSGVAVRTSIDGGHTWSERRPIVESRSDAAEEVQKWNRPHVQVLEDGRMLALCDVFPAVPGEDTDHTNSHTVFWWSDDQGETWSEPEHTDVIGLVPDRVIELPSGAWLLATCVRMKEGSYDRQGTTVQIAHRSENRGKTWEGPYVIGQHDRHNLSEGSVLLLPDGELVCYIREDTGLGVAAFKSFSNDEGRTWDGLYNSPLDGCHAPTARLLPSGKVLVTYRYQQGGSTGTYRSTPADWHKEYPPARAGGPTSYWARNTFAYLESVESAKARDLDQQGGVVLPLVWCLVNNHTQMRAPLRGSARRAAGRNPHRAFPGWPTRRPPQCRLIAGQQGAFASQRRSRPRGGAYGHSSLGAALLEGKIAPVCV